MKLPSSSGNNRHDKSGIVYKTPHCQHLPIRPQTWQKRHVTRNAPLSLLMHGIITHSREPKRHFFSGYFLVVSMAISETVAKVNAHHLASSCIQHQIGRMSVPVPRRIHSATLNVVMKVVCLAIQTSYVDHVPQYNVFKIQPDVCSNVAKSLSRCNMPGDGTEWYNIADTIEQKLPFLIDAWASETCNLSYRTSPTLDLWMTSWYCCGLNV
jgi:hypothetical protein